MLGLLNKTATVLKRVPQVDEYGSDASWFEEQPPAVACRIRQLSASERVEHAEEVVSTHRAYFMPGVAIASPDRLSCDGSTYDVLSVYPVNGSSTLHHLEADLLLLDGSLEKPIPGGY